MHAMMFYFLFRNFYNETYKKKKSQKIPLDKKNLNCKKQEEKVQSALNSIKKNDNENGIIYANQYKMATGYISDSGLRNRVFIDNRGFD